MSNIRNNSFLNNAIGFKRAERFGKKELIFNLDSILELTERRLSTDHAHLLEKIKCSNNSNTGRVHEWVKTLDPTLLKHKWESLNPEVKKLLIRIDCQSPGGNDCVKRWLKSNFRDFVAHNVWNTNIEKILRDGSLKPAEKVLRSLGSVNFEQGDEYGQRGVVTLQKISQEDRRALESYFILGKICFIKKENDQDIAFEVYQSNDFDDKDEYIQFYKESEEYTYEKDDKVSILKIKASPEINKISMIYRDRFNPKYKFYVDLKRKTKKRYGLSCELKLGSWGILKKKINELEKLGIKNKTTIKVALISSEIANSKEIDSILYTIYEHAIKEGVNSDEATYALSELRRRYYSDTLKMLPTVRFSRNRIYWNYGSLCILKGNPKPVLATEYDRRIRSGEVLGKYPWQNEGKLWQLELNNEEVLMLANESIVQKFGRRYPNLVSIDELTSVQKAFFNTDISSIS